MDKYKVTNMTFGGVNDYPDFADGYIESGEIDGRPLTEDELDELNEDSDFVYNCIYDNF